MRELRFDKLEEPKGFGKLTMARSIIFFFDVFLALMIITGSYIMIKTQAGKVSLLFGFFMLGLSTFLRILKKW